MDHTLRTIFIITCISYTTLFFGMGAFSNFPSELTQKILLYTLYPHATMLIHIATVSKNWYTLITSDTFSDRWCSDTNITPKPAIIFFCTNDYNPLKPLESAQSITSYGLSLSPCTAGHKTYINETATFRYIDSSALKAYPEYKSIFHDGVRTFIGIVVNSTVTQVCYSDHSKNPEPKKTLSYYIEHIHKKEFDPHTIAVKLPIDAARFINKNSYFFKLKLHKSDMTNNGEHKSNNTMDIDKD